VHPLLAVETAVLKPSLLAGTHGSRGCCRSRADPCSGSCVPARLAPCQRGLPHVFAWRGRSRERSSEGNSEALTTRHVCMHSRTRTFIGILESLQLRIVYVKAIFQQ